MDTRSSGQSSNVNHVFPTDRLHIPESISPCGSHVYSTSAYKSCISQRSLTPAMAWVAITVAEKNPGGVG